MSTHYPNCPYCEKETEIEIDGQDYNENYSTKCENCGKEFNYYFEYSIDIFTSKKEEKK